MKSNIIWFLAFILMATPTLAYAMGERESSSRLNQKCTDTIFFKIDNRIIESANRRSYPRSYEGKELDTCQSSLRSPVQAEEVTLNSNELDLPQHHKKLEFQIILSSSSSHRRNELSYVVAELKKENKTIKDLKKVGSFYEYKFYKIADNKTLTGLDGKPVLLQVIPPVTSVGNYMYFVWKDKILIRLSTLPTSRFPAEDWLEVYPRVLKYLDSMDRTP